MYQNQGDVPGMYPNQGDDPDMRLNQGVAMGLHPNYGFGTRYQQTSAHHCENQLAHCPEYETRITERKREKEEGGLGRGGWGVGVMHSVGSCGY